MLRGACPERRRRAQHDKSPRFRFLRPLVAFQEAMPKPSKRMRESAKVIDREKTYTVPDAVTALKQSAKAKFDESVVVTPDLMGQVGKIGKILGPRGLMPNPKSGTVTMDIGKAVRSIKAGQVAFRVDKAGIVHVPVGRASFDEQKLQENVMALVEQVK